MFPQARVYRGLDLPSTPASAAQRLREPGRVVDGLRDAIALGVPAAPRARAQEPARVTFHVAGHRPLRCEWRQRATLGELLLDAIAGAEHLNPNVSPGVMARLRFVLAGVHLTASAVTQNYSGESGLYVYVAAVGGVQQAGETE